MASASTHPVVHLERSTTRSVHRLPYVKVCDISRGTRRAEGLAASVIREPREGPAGWRSVVAAPSGGRGGAVAAEG